MAIIRKKRITFEISFDYPVDMDNEDILDMFAKQIVDAASGISSGDIDTVDVSEPSESEKSMDKLFDNWVIFLQKLDTFHKGFNVFTDKSSKLKVLELRDIIRGGRNALDEKIDQIRDENEEMEYQMFKSTFRTFLSDESVDENIIADEERFREEFEGYIHWNIEKLFDFPVLLMDAKRYDFDNYGISREIDESDPEQKEFKYKALRYISEEQLSKILEDSWDGSGFFGIIISGHDIIKAMKDNNVVSSNEIVIGIHDGFNGEARFEIVDTSKDGDKGKYKIPISKSELDWGRYSVGNSSNDDVEWESE